jgi:hypothetical protein
MSLNALGVISRAMRLYGQLAAGDTPGANDAADALIAFNAMKRAWFGTLIGPRLTSIGLTGTSGQAENGGEYAMPYNTFNLMAPRNPRPGDRFGVVDVYGAFGTYSCAINPNGRSIANIPTGGTIVLATNGQSCRFWYRGDTGNWVTEGDTPSLASALEFPDHIIAYFPYMLAVVMAAEFSGDLSAEVEAANLEGRAVLARTYGRRGRANPEGALGLGAPAGLQQG